MRREDIDAVLLLSATEPTAPHWPPFEYLRMLKVIAEEPARRGAWVVESNAKVSGFAIASHVADQVELEAVVVAPLARNHGLGTMLIEEVASWGRKLAARRLLLEVRASNAAALRLYLRMSFVLDGRRANYYQNPEEDAMLMGLSL
jgi:ribosomal protein S18 acetylase RimI-like enzyme